MLLRDDERGPADRIHPIEYVLLVVIVLVLSALPSVIG